MDGGSDTIDLTKYSEQDLTLYRNRLSKQVKDTERRAKAQRKNQTMVVKRMQADNVKLTEEYNSLQVESRGIHNKYEKMKDQLYRIMQNDRYADKILLQIDEEIARAQKKGGPKKQIRANNSIQGAQTQRKPYVTPYLKMQQTQGQNYQADVLKQAYRSQFNPDNTHSHSLQQLMTDFKKAQDKERVLGERMEKAFGDHPGFNQGAVPGIKIGDIGENKPGPNTA